MTEENPETRTYRNITAEQQDTSPVGPDHCRFLDPDHCRPVGPDHCSFWTQISTGFWAQITAGLWAQFTKGFGAQISAGFWVQITAGFWVQFTAGQQQTCMTRSSTGLTVCLSIKSMFNSIKTDIDSKHLDLSKARHFYSFQFCSGLSAPL